MLKYDNESGGCGSSQLDRRQNHSPEIVAVNCIWILQIPSHIETFTQTALFISGNSNAPIESGHSIQIQYQNIPIIISMKRTKIKFINLMRITYAN